jgi:small GTP-binding protein
MENLNDQEKPTKILIMGLDNCGKTSILISLRKDANILSYFSLRPTKGVVIEKFEENIVCWDLGGQRKYREEYLKDLGKYVKNTDKIIFVIDVQDIKRFELALEYLNRVIENLISSNTNVDFSIFLHKYDPNLNKLDKFRDIDSIIETKLVSEVRKTISSNFNYDIFKTTIYTVFEKTSY